jgi:cell division transport system permease protein
MIQAVKEAFAAIRRSRLTALAAVGTLTIFMFLLGLFLLAHVNLTTVADTIRQRVQIEAFLDDGLSAQSIQDLSGRIEALEAVAAVQYIDKEAALEIFRRQFGEEALQALETNPLPASLKIELHPGERTFQGVSRTARRIADLPGVIDVEYGRQWLSRLDALLGLVGIATFALGLILAVCTVLVVATTIRLAFHARSEAVEIMHLVGADPGFVARPFVIEGAVYGFLGSLAGVLFLGLLFAIVSRRLPGLRFVPPPALAGLLIAGALLGGIGSLLSLRRAPAR